MSAYIEDFFLLDVLCSLVGGLVVLFIYLVLAEAPRTRQRTWTFGLLAVFLASSIATLTFYATLDRYWTLDGQWATLIEVAWALSYTLLLVGLGGTVMAWLLARSRAGSAVPSRA